MASRGPLVGAARLFSSDRLDDMERRFQDGGKQVKGGLLGILQGMQFSDF